MAAGADGAIEKNQYPTRASSGVRSSDANAQLHVTAEAAEKKRGWWERSCQPH